MDLFSGYSYSFMIRKASLQQVIDGKKAFEKELDKYNVETKKYRVDNRRFVEKGFYKEVKACNQTITFCSL